MANNSRTKQEIAVERYQSMSRRGFLRGVGACIALPALPSLLPRLANAADAPEALGAIPLRLIERHRVCPFRLEEGRLRVATLAPRETAPLPDQALLFCRLRRALCLAGLALGLRLQ